MSDGYASDMTSGKLFSYHFCIEAQKDSFAAIFMARRQHFMLASLLLYPWRTIKTNIYSLIHESNHFKKKISICATHAVQSRHRRTCRHHPRIQICRTGGLPAEPLPHPGARPTDTQERQADSRGGEGVAIGLLQRHLPPQKRTDGDDRHEPALRHLGQPAGELSGGGIPARTRRTAALHLSHVYGCHGTVAEDCLPGTVC